jgi:hypothetical protein
VLSDDSTAEAPPFRRRPRTPIVLAVVVALLIGLGGLAVRGLNQKPLASAGASAGPSASPVVRPSGSPAPADRGYLVSLSELQARAARAAAGQQPEAAALADLLTWAKDAAGRHPKPAEPLRIDGTTGPFVDDTATAYGLALAWGATGDVRFATAARSFIMGWVTTTKTLEGACPDRGDCQTSLIVSRVAPGFVFAVDLLGSSGILTAADQSAFRTWLQTVILPAASIRTNNWGDAGDFLRVAATDFLGDRQGFAAAIDTWHAQLDLVAADGHIPEEVRRDSAGLSYTQEALLYKVAVARIAQRRGIDLWEARGAGGGTLHAAIQLMATAQRDPASWHWFKHVDVPDPGPGWELIYEHWPEAAFGAIVGPVRPLGWPGHSSIRWTTLTNGIPIGG